MTNIYSKIGSSTAAANNRSKSVDFWGLLQLPNSRPATEMTGWNIEALVELHDDEIDGERFGVVLGMCPVVSSLTAHTKGSRTESKQKVGSSSAEGKYSAVKRVFSMRRSASVSERYCRIHDQSITPTAYFESEDSMDEETGSPVKPVKRKKQQEQQLRGGKIIKACKRLFNLK